MILRMTDSSMPEGGQSARATSSGSWKWEIPTNLESAWQRWREQSSQIPRYKNWDEQTLMAHFLALNDPRENP
jgi:hypothetical protein